MMYQKNNIARYYYNDSAAKRSVERLCELVSKYESLLELLENDNEEIRDILLKKHYAIDFRAVEESFPWGFFERTPTVTVNDLYIYPTVRKTTLFYDRLTDCFIKILHPTTVKAKVLSLFLNRSASMYRLSEKLIASGIKVPEILSYGVFLNGWKTFFVMERIKGNSLYYLTVKEKKSLPFKIYTRVIEDVANLHNLGYWFGDLRASHIFVKDTDIEGFVDADSIRKNKPFRLRNIAKDLAGLNSPEIPLTNSEKKDLFYHYLRSSHIKEKNLLQLIKHYTDRRWKNTQKK